MDLPSMSPGTPPTLKLWYSPGACSLAPHIVLLESGLEFDLILAQVGHFNDDFIALNPKGRVPVLMLDGEVITEMPAILTAISWLVLDRKLLGRTPMETIRVYEWLNWLSGTLHGQAYGAFLRPERFVDEVELRAVVKEKGVRTIRACYAYIESNLAEEGRVWAIGEDFTVVDPFLLVFYLWAPRAKIDLEAGYPRYAAWAKRLLKRESVAAALKVHSKL